MKPSEVHVLALANEVFERVSKITAPVDVHKRYDRDDVYDPYGAVIRWTYDEGGKLFCE
jgi:hypothetical protein